MQKLVFSADQLPGHLDDGARFRLFRDLWMAEMGSADMTHPDDRPFYSTAEFIPLAGAGVVRMATTSNFYMRSPAHVARDARDEMMIAFNHSKVPQWFRQNGRELDLTPGCVGVNTTAEPSENRTNDRVDWIGIVVSTQALRQLVPNVEDRIATLLDPTAPAVKHLGRYLEFLIRSPEVDGDPALQGEVATHLLDLAALALDARGDVAELARMRGLRGARAREILAEMRARFVDPAFSQADVAAKLGLSPRYVQDLLHETGMTFNERLMELRLQKARELLSDPRYGHLRINEVGLACGFYDSAHFSRCFRRRFGVSPAAYRTSG